MATYKKVLVLLDLAAGSEQVVIAGRDLAAHSNAALIVLHVVEFVPLEPAGPLSAAEFVVPGRPTRPIFGPVLPLAPDLEPVELWSGDAEPSA